jgi:menaquinone-specific isochorismate synthase
LCPGDGLVFLFSRRFDQEREPDSIWKEFEPGCAIIPEMMIVRTGSQFRFHHCAGISPDTDIAAVKAGIGRISIPDQVNIPLPIAPNEFAWARIVSFPRRDRWEDNVRQALRDIQAGRLKKVVLARRTDYEFSERIDPWSLFRMLRQFHPGGFAICHQVRPGTAFISFTPERLYSREGHSIAVDALSSTVPRGNSPEEDRRLEDHLMGDDKQCREHRFVVDGVSAMLNPLCRETPRIGRTSVVKLARVQHLWTPITGMLKEGIDDDRLVDGLHPTPAMGGTPPGNAAATIRRLESFDRGMYAAPWGIMTAAGAEFAVAIRSALVRGNVVSVFAGAGIVAGSDPGREWRELDSKDILRPYIAERMIP